MTKTTAYATFTSTKTAQGFLDHMARPTILILAESGKVLVPFTMKEADRLLAAGYSRG